jgi:hypothetical protein
MSAVHVVRRNGENVVELRVTQEEAEFIADAVASICISQDSAVAEWREIADALEAANNPAAEEDPGA